VTTLPVATATWLILLAIGVSSAIVHVGGLVGDQALIEFQTRELLSAQPPLTGTYSRYGWAHPGPAMFVLMAPAYFAFGASGTSLMIGASVVNATFGAASVALVERSHRRAGLALLGLLTFVLLSADESILAEPWNPRATVIPLILIVTASTVASLGDDLGAGVLIVATVFVVSTHAGIGVAVLPLAVFGLGLWWYRSRRWPPRWSLGIAAALSVPVLADVVSDWPGNPGRLVRFALTDNSAQLGSQNAVRFILRSTSPEFLLPDRYDGFAGFVTPTQPLGLLPGLLLAVLLFLSWRGAGPTIKNAARLVLVGFAGSAVSISNIRGVPFEYLLLPLPVLAACGWAIAATHVWIVSTNRLSWKVRSPLAIGFVLVGLLVVAAAVSEIGGTDDKPGVSAIVNDAATATVRSELDGPVIVTADIGDPFALIEYFGGLMNELDRRSVDVRVLPGTAEIVGDGRDGDPATSAHITVSVLPVGAEVPDRGAVIFTSPPEQGNVVRLQLRQPASTTE
jgi:hypothetical protein